MNIVTTATANQGVVLSALAVGRSVGVANRTAVAIVLYPASGANFDGLAANAGITLPAGATIEVQSSTATQLITTYNGAVAGAYVVGNITGNAANVTGTVAVANGGTGATTLTGYVKGAGTSALTASATIPNTDISGLGTMSTQNASAVAITGGTIDNVTFDGGTF